MRRPYFRSRFPPTSSVGAQSTRLSRYRTVVFHGYGMARECNDRFPTGSQKWPNCACGPADASWAHSRPSTRSRAILRALATRSDLPRSHTTTQNVRGAHVDLHCERWRLWVSSGTYRGPLQVIMTQESVPLVHIAFVKLLLLSRNTCFVPSSGLHRSRMHVG